jgi:hypothetical protein
VADFGREAVSDLQWGEIQRYRIPKTRQLQQTGIALVVVGGLRVMEARAS